MKLNDQFELTRDKWNWILTELVRTKKKNGTHGWSKKYTYHANLDQVAKHILHVYSIDVPSLNELINVCNAAAKDISDSLKQSAGKC